MLGPLSLLITSIRSSEVYLSKFTAGNSKTPIVQRQPNIIKNNMYKFNSEESWETCSPSSSLTSIYLSSLIPQYPPSFLLPLLYPLQIPSQSHHPSLPLPSPTVLIIFSYCLISSCCPIVPLSIFPFRLPPSSRLLIFLFFSTRNVERTIAGQERQLQLVNSYSVASKAVKEKGPYCINWHN